MKYKNLLLVSGSGRNSGKTTFVCTVIEKLRVRKITAIKISPHFHKPSEGLVHFSGGPGFDIYHETSISSSKDSSRMLKCGAIKVYYIQAKEENIITAFSEIYSQIPSGNPIICESPALLNYLEPGLFVMMNSHENINPKTINILKRPPDLEYKIEELTESSIPVEFTGGKWKCTK